MILRVNPRRGVRVRRWTSEDDLEFKPAALAMRDLGSWKMYDVQVAELDDHHVVRAIRRYDDARFEQMFFLPRRAAAHDSVPPAAVEAWNLEVHKG